MLIHSSGEGLSTMLSVELTPLNTFNVHEIKSNIWWKDLFHVVCKVKTTLRPFSRHLHSSVQPPHHCWNIHVFLKLFHEVWFMSRHKNNLVRERSWSALDYQGWCQACSNYHQYQWFFSQTSDQIANLKTCYFGLHILSHSLVTCHNEYLNLQSNLMSQM